MLWTNPKEGQKIKKLYEKHYNIDLIEVFLEAVPTVLVMTILAFKATTGKF